MGFSLQVFFEELIEVLDSDMKAAKKIRALCRIIQEGRAYAKECGLIDKRQP